MKKFGDNMLLYFMFGWMWQAINSPWWIFFTAFAIAGVLNGIQSYLLARHAKKSGMKILQDADDF